MPTAVHVGRGASYLVIQTIIANAVTVASFAVLARIISPKEMGVWAVLMLVNGIVVNIGPMAVPSAAVKFIAENASRSNMKAAAAAFYQSLKLAIVSATLLAVPSICPDTLGSNLASWLIGDRSYSQLFRVLAIDIFLNTGALSVLGSVSLGFQKFKETAVIGITVNSLISRHSLFR